MRRSILILIFLFSALPVGAKDFYIAAKQAGTGSGTGCSTAKPYTWFNTSSSWGTGASQIGPGTTVHLCGTFTGTAGQTLLSAGGSGTSSSPITIKFEPNAVLAAPYWSSQGTINELGRSYIVIDGGTNGLIKNTANGTGRGNAQDSRAIYAQSCTGCVVKNLTIADLYVRTSVTDLAVRQTAVNCVYWLNSNNITITHVTCHDAGLHIWGQNGGIATNGVIYNNVFDGDSGVNITAHIYLQDSIKNVSVYNNVFLVPYNRTINSLWFSGITQAGVLPGGPATGNSAYNNFIRTGGHVRGAAIYAMAQNNFTVVNNVLLGGNADISVQGGGYLSSAGINNNIYEDLLADAGSYNSFYYQGHNYHDLASWQAACHCDSRSKLVPASKINASSLGQLLSGSVAVSAAANLLNISSGSLSALSKDKVGAARQLSGNWDAGAYKFW